MGKAKKFLRTNVTEYSKLGKRRKKLLKYRRMRGRDNKTRIKKRGHLRNVSIGFKNNIKTREQVNGKKPVVVFNLEGIKNLKQDEIGILSKIGNKKKIEIANYCIHHKIRLFNLNNEKFLAKIKKEKEEAKEKKEDDEKKKEEEKKLQIKKEAEAKEKKEDGIEKKVETTAKDEKHKNNSMKEVNSNENRK